MKLPQLQCFMTIAACHKPHMMTCGQLARRLLCAAVATNDSKGWVVAALTAMRLMLIATHKRGYKFEILCFAFQLLYIMLSRGTVAFCAHFKEF